VSDSLELSEYTGFFHQLADQAGEIGRHYFRTGVAVEQKADHSPVTRADREIEAALHAAIRAAYPDHGILGEEQEAHRPDAEWLWVIDPIDGTRAFIAGQATFVTLIALCHRGEPVMGIIDQPVVRERWLGGTGQPTLFNGKPVQAVPCKDIKNARIATTSLPYFDDHERAVYDQLAAQCAEIAPGQDGYSYGLLARGELDIVVDASMKPYDYLALAPVVIGAGGIISDWQGKSLNIHSAGDVVATGSTILYSSVINALSYSLPATP
jgi:inositol-phosphate phosphatase / L-galactose 1-phosphate phosphatase / histidinol-phosphatase